MSRKLMSRAAAMAAGAVVIVAATLFPASVSPVAAAEQAPLAVFIVHQCVGLVCMNLQELTGGKRLATFSSQNGSAFTDAVHLNIRDTHGNQIEICSSCSWSFSAKPEADPIRSASRFVKRTQLSPSTCHDWSVFHYKAPPAVEAEAPQVVPLPGKGKHSAGDYAVKEVEALPDKGKGAGAYVLKDSVGKQGADLSVGSMSGPGKLQAGLSGTYKVTVKNGGDLERQRRAYHPLCQSAWTRPARSFRGPALPAPLSVTAARSTPRYIALAADWLRR